MGSLYFQIASIFILGLISIVYFSKKKVDSIETKLFSKLLIINLIGVSIDIILISLEYVIPKHDILYFLSKFYNAFIIVWIHSFLMYILHITNRNINKKKIKIFSYSFLLIAIAIIFILPISIHHDATRIYTYGTSVDFIFILATVIALIAAYRVISRFERDKLKKYIPLIALISLFSLGLLVRQIDPGILFTSFVITFITTVMYFTIENPDVKMIEQLDKAKKEAERANQAKTDFLSSMSHEIRTPLNAIVGFSEFIKSEDNLDKAKSDADDILMASQNLLEIVNGILDISKIEADKMEIVYSEYELLPHLENIIKMVKPRIKDKPVEFEYSFASDLPATMYGDAGKVKQVITNLMTNAAKYTEQGKISLTVNCVNNDKYSTLVVVVKDTGRGIKQDQVNKLFTKFNRLDEDKNSTLEGTGLGLAITKKFVEMMGGKIVVQSEYGKGSTFILYLNQRIVSLNNGLTKKSKEFKNYKFPNSKVLVVDDNPLNLKVAAKLLSNYDIAPDLIDNGQLCIDKITNKDHYDLILLDDMMPNMRGGEVVKKLKQLPDFGIPVVVLTANAISGMREQYLREGFDDYLAKPIELNMLEGVLSKFLKKQEIVTVFKPQYKILIVDDNSLNIKIASKLLSIYNFDIKSVLSGQECVNAIRQGEKYDLIFMDIMMPSMSGVETFKQLKTIPNFDTPVVVLTADAVKGAKENYLNEGFNDYITKPLDKSLLQEILCKYLVMDICPVPQKPKEKINLDEHGIDTKKALEVLGDLETYKEMLKEFINNVDTAIEELTLFKDDRLNDYAVRVHSLKSDAKYLGFIKLAELSYEHEMKSKESNHEYILTNFDELINETKRIKDVISQYLL